MLHHIRHIVRHCWRTSSYVLAVWSIVQFAPFEAHSQQMKYKVDSLTRAYQQAQNAHNDTLSILLLGDIAKTLWGTYSDSAMGYAQQMLAYAERVHFERGKGIALNSIAYIYRKKSRFDECLEYSYKALAVVEALGDTVTAAWCYHNIGNVHYARGRFDIALENHFKALRLREAIGEKTAVAWSLSNISDIYRDQGYKPQALEYTKKAIVVFQEVNDKHGAAVALNSVGVMLQEEGKYDEAYACFAQALELDKASEHGIGMIWSMRYLGEVSLLQKRYDRAERYFLDCLELCRKLKDQRNEGSALLNLARLYKMKNDLPRAFANVRAAIVLADTLHIQSLSQNLYEIASELNAATGDYALAYEYHKRYSALHDSLFSAESSKKIAEMTTLYDAEKRKREIEVLTKDNALQEAALKRDALTRNSLIIGVVVLLIIAGLLVQRHRIQTRAQADLQQKNDEITRQQHILEDQAAEIEIANTQLHEQNLILQQFNLEKNEFLGIAAHDLKNPLTAITMSASSIREYYDRLSREAVRERLGAIIVASQRMASIISNLLDINAIETGNLNLQFQTLDVTPLVEQSVHDYQERAEAKGITLHFENSCTHAALVSVDAGIMAEIFDNLLSNAIKYSHPQKQVLMSLSQANNVVRIEVQDEGPGLNDDDKKRLFGKFARLSAQPTGGEHSTGLGLSIVKRLTEAMHGRVGCESVLGSGATFFVEFPEAT
jgi:signal transduction histidine kinase